MMRLKKTILVGLLFVTTLLGSCGLQLRSAADLPPQLHTVYFDSPKPNSQLSIDLRNLLKGADITLVKDQAGAPVTLRVNHYNYHHSNPSITSTSVAVTYSLAINVSLQLFDAHNRPITQAKIFSVSRSLILTSDQIFTPGVDTLAKQEMDRELTILIFQWLASDNVKNDLLQHRVHGRQGAKKHAAKT